MKHSRWLLAALLVGALAAESKDDPCVAFLRQLTDSLDLVEKIRHGAEKVVEWAHSNNIRVVVVSGRSGSTSAAIFLAAWTARYPQATPPQIVDLGEIGNHLLYKYIYPKDQRQSQGQGVLEPYIGKDSGAIAETNDPLRQQAMAKFLTAHFPKAFERKDAPVLYLDSHSDSGTKAGGVQEALAAQGLKDVRYAVYAGNPETPESKDPRYLIGTRLTWPERFEYGRAAFGLSGAEEKVPFPLVYPEQK